MTDAVWEDVVVHGTPQTLDVYVSLTGWERFRRESFLFPCSSSVVFGTRGRRGRGQGAKGKVTHGMSLTTNLPSFPAASPDDLMEQSFSSLH